MALWGGGGALRVPQPLVASEKAGSRMGVNVGHPKSHWRVMAEGRDQVSCSQY